ncbi:MAG: hypothetical protein MJZ83_09455 [Bacteroidaceae bacterium]|nr:hypothetical protein [Bacteroidaceae bacterium]
MRGVVGLLVTVIWRVNKNPEDKASHVTQTSEAMSSHHPDCSGQLISSGIMDFA